MIDPKTSLGDHTVVQFASCQQASGGDPVLLTAGATEDGVEIPGEAINRRDAMSCVLAIVGKAVLGSTETISFAVDYQESPDNSAWDTAVELQAATVAATYIAGTEEFEVDLPLSLKGKKKFIRFNITPTMSAGSADIAVWGAACHLGGYNTLPAAVATEIT